MPTTAKLVSAVAFALVALLAAVAYIPHLPENTSVGYFREIMAALGLLLGWQSMGRNAGRGWGEAAGQGLKTSALIVFWALLSFASYTMILRSTKQIYRADPVKALLDVPRIMLDYGRLAVAQDVLAVLILGGLLGGLLAEFTARRRK